jgi:hypothetical protein
MSKLVLLKEYIAVQAEDQALWFEAEHISEAYLQSELRRVAFLIEEATEDDIKLAINRLKKELDL